MALIRAQSRARTREPPAHNGRRRRSCQPTPAPPHVRERRQPRIRRCTPCLHHRVRCLGHVGEILLGKRHCAVIERDQIPRHLTTPFPAACSGRISPSCGHPRNGDRQATENSSVRPDPASLLRASSRQTGAAEGGWGHGSSRSTSSSVSSLRPWANARLSPTIRKRHLVNTRIDATLSLAAPA